MDDVVVIHDMIALAAGGRAAPVKRHQQRAADERLEAAVMQPDPQPVADQPGRHCVEDLLEREPESSGGWRAC